MRGGRWSTTPSSLDWQQVLVQVQALVLVLVLVLAAKEQQQTLPLLRW